MGDTGRCGDHPLRFQRNRVGRDAVEEAHAGAEEDGNQVDLDLVEQAGAQVLLSHLASTRDQHVLLACDGTRLSQRLVDAAGDEVERRAGARDDLLARVMREDEDRHLEGRLVAPPAACVRIVPPGALRRR